jgi:hypothetical protein
MAPKQGFEDLWEEALDKYIESTGRTLPEQALLGQLKSPEDLEKQLEIDRDRFTSFRAKHGKLTERLKKARCFQVSPLVPFDSLLSRLLRRFLVPLSSLYKLPMEYQRRMIGSTNFSISSVTSQSAWTSTARKV